jgi:FMN-dependent NADH-azoreductase
MTTILHIDSSPLGDRSVSRKLGARTVADLKAKHPDATLVTRDLALHPMPHLDGSTIGAYFTPPDQHDEHLSAAIKLSDDATAELLGADIIVIGAPMWNFSIPSGLKAWIDHIVRAGKTFKYTATGVEPLALGKKAIVLVSRGGVYSQGPMAAMDYQETYLRTILGFIGLKDVTFIRAEGTAMGPEVAKKAVEDAEGSIDEAVEAMA